MRLLLPAIIPSWRFFDVIAPAPRIEFTSLLSPEDEPTVWQEFRPRPERVSVFCLILCLFWNPRRNETLYLASCAERLMQNPTDHGVLEISRRIAGDLPPNQYAQFRLIFSMRHEEQMHEELTYISPVFPT